MLQEAHRRKGRGTDVVIGFVETYGRPRTEALVAGLEVVPRASMPYRGATFPEMDLDAVLARRPQVAMVDELAHTNVPGSRNTKRRQDIQELLDAGITVLSTVNIQHLESLNDVVQQITGVPQRETVPDETVREADQVELVDMTPEALRRRMVHGNVYPADRIEAALGNYFRVGNLTALREPALLWLADKVDDQLDRYRAEHHIADTWEARERVVVALTGGPEGETLIRRAARIAARTKGADLLAVHVSRDDGLAGADPALLARQRSLVESLGGTYHHVVGADVPAALLDFARGANATQLVLGASRRGRAAQLFAPGVGVTTATRSGPIDVHLVTHDEIGKGQRRRTASWGALSLRRQLVGPALALVGVPMLVLLLGRLASVLFLPIAMLCTLSAIILVALVGGRWPALVAAVVGASSLAFFFLPPYRAFAAPYAEEAAALVLFLLVAVALSAVVDVAARRTREAARAAAEAQTLATMAGSVMHGTHPLTALLEQVRETFGLAAAALLERIPETGDGPDVQRDPSAWRVVAGAGERPCRAPGEGDAEVPVDDGLALVLRGRPLEAADRRAVEAFAALAATALRQERLAGDTAESRPRPEPDGQADEALLRRLERWPGRSP